jgi:ABC-type transport system substrate-binding protein
MLLAIVVALVVVVAAIGAAWAFGLFGGEKTEKVLVIAMAEDITVMDPSKANWMFGPACVIYDTLLTRDLDGGYADGLADTWVMDPINLTLLLNLKPNMKFHDGTPCDAEAIKWNIEYQSAGYSGYMFGAIEEVYVIDPETVQFNLSYADASLMFNLSNIYSAIMSPTAVEAAGDDYGVGTNVTGSGPFKILEWVSGDHVTVVKNDDYRWAPSWMENEGPAHIDKIIYRIIPDDTARFLGFESGSIDVLMNVPPFKMEQYDAMDDVSVITGPGQGVFAIEFNCAKAPWDNASLRKAFSYAINRTEIMETVWHGVGTIAPNYLPPILPETNVDPALNFTYDPVKAAALLAEAGYVNSDSDDWVEKGGEELTLNLWTTTRAEDVSMGEILLDQFEAIGVHVSVAHYAQNTLDDLCADGQHDSALFKDSWPRADILDWLLGSGYIPYPNTAQFNDSEFDSLILAGYESTTDAEYTANMIAAHERLLVLGPWAPIIYWDQMHAVHDYVTGWTVHPLGQETVQALVDVDIEK